MVEVAIMLLLHIQEGQVILHQQVQLKVFLVAKVVSVLLVKVAVAVVLVQLAMLVM